MCIVFTSLVLLCLCRNHDAHCGIWRHIAYQQLRNHPDSHHSGLRYELFNIGTVLSGYIISEIGHILTAMRQERDDFEQDIQNADTICSNYQLDHELKHRVRNYIVNNRLAN